LSDFPGPREKTEIKVLKTVKELNYEINAIARSLIQKETNTIGIIVGNVLSNKLEYDDNKTLKRFKFYERASHTYRIVASSEQALYANIILKKGVVE